MVPFRKYVTSILSESKQNVRGEREEALENAGRYLAKMVDLHTEMKGADSSDPSSNLMYNMGALTALHNYFLGVKYPHLKPFAKFGSDEQKQKNLEAISASFPHLVPHIDSKITEWG